MTADTQFNQKASQERLTAVHRWTDTLLTFRTSRPAGYCFVPGQFARLGLLVDGEMIWRAYSITSAEQENELEYYAVVVPGGVFTSVLNQLRPGDPVWVEKLSYGFMTPDRFTGGEDFWMLATGTGLGPFLSILQQRDVWQRFRHLVLVHGVRFAEELTYQDRLRTLQEQAQELQLPARLQLLRTTTRQQSGSGPVTLHGRITDLLRNGSLERTAQLEITAASSRLMVCGNPEMINEVRTLLRERHLGPCRRAGGGQFITEDYW